MGPADPFAHRAPDQGAAPQGDPEAAPPAGSSARAAAERAAAAGAPVWGGFAAGVLFGLLVLLFGFGEAVFVLLLGGAGAALGWLIGGLRRGTLDVGAAWQALRRP